MRILVTGATGFIGRALCERLAADGHELVALARNPERARAQLPGAVRLYPWSAGSSEPPAEAVQGTEAVVHLAGESVVGLWTAAKRRKIIDSRRDGARSLIAALRRLPTPPKAFVSASAIGFYGDRGDELLDELKPAGEGFTAETCTIWEEEAARVEELGTRRVSLRIALVLERDGGALGSMLLPAKLGLGGPLGSGKQWWSWIHRDDLVELIRFALENERLSGAVNAAAPNPVTQREFAKTLGRVLHRPAFLPAPAWALKLLLGGFSYELLSSKRIVPQAALDAGFEFRHAELEPALRDILG